MYTLSRYWQCGSCPHLFLEGSSPLAVWYKGELFGRMPGLSQEHSIAIPVGVTALTVAELEDETTVLERVEVNGILISENQRLTKGTLLRVDVCAGDNFFLRGHYQTRLSLPPTPWRRNEIVGTFMRYRLTTSGTRPTLPVA